MLVFSQGNECVQGLSLRAHELRVKSRCVREGTFVTVEYPEPVIQAVTQEDAKGASPHVARSKDCDRFVGYHASG